MNALLRALAALPLLAVLARGADAPLPRPDTPFGRPDAILDLDDAKVQELLHAEWKVADADIVGVEHHAVGPDLKPSGPKNRTHDWTLQAGARDFDDASFETLAPGTLDSRHSAGRLAAAWYRIRVTLPEKAGDVDVSGARVVFEIVADDYAEVWVDGALPLALGQRGGALVAGYNAANRVVLTDDARPGQSIQLAICVLNGPFSAPPANYVWVRSATLDVYANRRGRAVVPAALTVRRLDPALDAIVAPDARLEKLAEGFSFTEGPVWMDGALLFSDPNENVIHRWSPKDGLSVFRTKSGYKGADIHLYGQPGSNGLALDPEGRLTICEHGNRRVTRLEKNGVLTVLADRFEGKRLNSPNDLTYRSDGALYFTDPPFGLPKFHDDPRRELPFCAVFCWKDGVLKAVAKELNGPNGLAFSPDEAWLYVSNWDEKRKVVRRYAVRPDGSLDAGTDFFSMQDAPESEALDGLKVDTAGNLFVSGPGGVWILAADGRHLGTLLCPELPANFAFGDPDGRTLYLTARTGLYRLRLASVSG